MHLTELLATALETGVQTVRYLFAYAWALVLAPAVHLALIALAPSRRGWLPAVSSGAPARGLAAAVRGVTEPLSRRAFGSNLAALGSPAAGAVYLAVSHALTAYTWILMGPLLGKDFLLSHAVGVLLFASLAAALARAFRVPAAREETPRAPRLGRVATLAAATLRFGLLAALGLGLGGAVAAWGFSPGTWAPATTGSGGGWTQLSNGALGLALALLGIPPVANLFVGTFLWKVGLAHAGIVAFFCAAPAAPTRWRLYARLYGKRGARRFVAALLIAALLAGLATAWVFGALDVPIRYKLIPQQLWEVR